MGGSGGGNYLALGEYPIPAKGPPVPSVANERLLSRFPIHVVGCVAVPFPSDPGEGAMRGDSRADGKRPKGGEGGA